MLTFTMPFWVLIGAHFLLGETMGLWQAVGAIISLLGMVVIVAHGDLAALASLKLNDELSIGLLPLFATCDRWDIGGVSTAHHAAPRFSPIAIVVGKGWRLSIGMGTGVGAPDRPSPSWPVSVQPIASRMSSTGLTLDSGWSRGTYRSSPHQTWTTGHGTASRNGESASRR